jgi:hypothetical protein
MYLPGPRVGEPEAEEARLVLQILWNRNQWHSLTMSTKIYDYFAILMRLTLLGYYTPLEFHLSRF